MEIKIENIKNKLRVMVQVKMGQEESKTGVPEKDVISFCHQINALKELELCGRLLPRRGPAHHAEQLRVRRRRLADRRRGRQLVHGRQVVRRRGAGRNGLA